MTVLTKPLSGLQPKKPEKSVEKLIEETGIPVYAEDSDETDSVTYPYHRVTRVGRLTNCCLLVSLLALLILGIGAGVHSYKIYLLRNTYAGVCHLPLRNFFNENTAFGESMKKRLMSEAPYHFLLDNMAPFQARQEQSRGLDEVRATFDFDIDVEEENYEVLEMPELFIGRYMHDFSENKTVIIDSLQNRCYVMRLDRARIAPPKNIFDIITKIRMGYYSLDFKQIKKNYRIVGEALSSLDGYGDLVSRACSHKTTYRLEELVGDVIVKREATETLEKFGEFTGDAIIQYHIVNDV